MQTAAAALQIHCRGGQCYSKEDMIEDGIIGTKVLYFSTSPLEDGDVLGGYLKAVTGYGELLYADAGDEQMDCRLDFEMRGSLRLVGASCQRGETLFSVVNRGDVIVFPRDNYSTSAQDADWNHDVSYFLVLPSYQHQPMVAQLQK